jgi:hypothetical protein
MRFATLSFALGIGVAIATPHTRAFSQSASTVSVPDSEPALATFLVGRWSCRGGTPAGRRLDSQVVFRRVVGGHWLEVTHQDVPPGKYMSESLWPARSRPNIVSVVYDNFDGDRRFIAASWTADSIVWVRDTSEAKARLESFTYRRMSPASYWYAWHVVRTPGTPIVLGDSATCLRVE